MQPSKALQRITIVSLFLLFFGVSQSALSQVPKDLAWQTLQADVKDRDARTRALALRSFGLVPSNEIAEKLVAESLKDPVDQVRIFAASALGMMNARGSIPALKEALEDKNVGVILAAAGDWICPVPGLGIGEIKAVTPNENLACAPLPRLAWQPIRIRRVAKPWFALSRTKLDCSCGGPG